MQRSRQLGPNGALVACMVVLADNWDWLAGKLRPLMARNVVRGPPGGRD